MIDRAFMETYSRYGIIDMDDQNKNFAYLIMLFPWGDYRTDTPCIERGYEEVHRFVCLTNFQG